MKVRMKIQPSGLYNGEPWPAVGEVIELPDHVAVGMLNSKLVEPIKGDGEEETATPDAAAQETATPKPARKNAKQVAAKAETDAPETPAETDAPAED